MIQIYTAFTREIDDPEEAVREIIEQIKPAENMLANTIGIVQFHHEFAETGVYQAIAGALPFEIVGCATSFISTNDQYGEFSLAVTMLTADDVNFSVWTLENADAKSREQIFDEITQISAGMCVRETPKMVMPFLSQLTHFSGDDLITMVNALRNPFPLFGTIAFSEENKKGNNIVVQGGKISCDMYAFAAFYGDLEPTFRVTTSFDYDENLGDTAEISDAEGPVLKAVNGIPTAEYLRKKGLLNEASISGNWSVWVVPAIMTRLDGSKVARAFLGVVPGTNDIYSAGALEMGAKISFAYMNREKTLSSAERLLEQIDAANENNIIAFSCAARSWSLDSQYLAEINKIAECADKYRQKNNVPLNYCVSYSAGEICPLLNDNGELVNTLHNYTLISCSFS